MEKSQLRRLALDFADGQIGAPDYRQQRRALIDGIVDGSVTIERERRLPPPPAPSPLPPPEDIVRPDTGPAPDPAPRRGLPAPAWLAVASVACVVIAVLLWPAAQAPETPPRAPAPAVPALELPRARTLVESFIARRDFSIDAVAAFESAWTALEPQERDEARGALWFASLARALRDEVKTQQALAGLSESPAPRQRVQRLLDLGETLGIADPVPVREDPQRMTDTTPAAGPQAPPAGTIPPPAGAIPPPAGTIPPPAGTTPPPAATPATPPASPAVSADTAALTGRQWLARRDDAQLTLQLFAVNGLDRVEALMAAHPELTVRILATDGAAPRYRVFHGVFTDEASARRAFDALPDTITGASGGAIVKSFAAVREDLAGGGAAAAPAARPAANVAAAGRDYTLQLFASGNRANAESLVKAFPDLSLQLRRLNGDAAPFRVVYGRFASERLARAAGETLPPALLSRIGTPLAKRVADTGSSLDP